MQLLYANGPAGQHPKSWYADTSTSASYPAINSDQQCDVCVIGAGYTGLSAAIHLQQHGLKVVVLEAHRIGWGASGRNGGQLGSGFNMEQPKLEKQFGHEKAHALWQYCEQAKHTVLGLCQTHDIDVEYRPGIIAAMHRKRYVKPAHDYCTRLENTYGYDKLERLSKSDIRALVGSDQYHGGAIDHGAGHLHPLKLAQGLAKIADTAGATLYENSAAIRITHENDNLHHVQTDAASVSCTRIVVACNGYLDSLIPSVQKKVMPINNFMVATEPLGDRANEILARNHAVFDSRFVVNYFRLSSDKRLLFGGGETYGYRFPNNIEALVRKPMSAVFPQLSDVKIDYAWGGTLAISLSRMPYIRQCQPNVYTACGYSGHGVALAVEAGRTIADAIHGDTERFDLVASIPAKNFPGGGRFQSTLLAGAMTISSLMDRF